jgi:hypothetical protein
LPRPSSRNRTAQGLTNRPKSSKPCVRPKDFTGAFATGHLRSSQCASDGIFVFRRMCQDRWRRPSRPHTPGSNMMQPRRQVVQGVLKSVGALGSCRRCWGSSGPSLRSTGFRGGAHIKLSQNFGPGASRGSRVLPKIIWAAGVLQADLPSPNEVNHGGSLGPFGVLYGSLSFSKNPHVSGVFSPFPRT